MIVPPGTALEPLPSKLTVVPGTNALAGAVVNVAVGGLSTCSVALVSGGGVPVHCTLSETV